MEQHGLLLGLLLFLAKIFIKGKVMLRKLWLHGYQTLPIMRTSYALNLQDVQLLYMKAMKGSITGLHFLVRNNSFCIHLREVIKEKDDY